MSARKVCSGIRPSLNSSRRAISAPESRPEIFTFTLRAVPAVVGELLRKADRKLDDIDAFIFHQANRHMLEHLRKRLHIPESRFPVCLEDCGNTVSSTIPIALKQCVERNQLRPGMTAMLVGFGVGYSWGATLIEW